MPSAELIPFEPVPTIMDIEAPPTVVTCAPTALTLFKALRRRWLLATSLGLVSAVTVALAAWLFLPAPPHTARSQVLVYADQPVVLFKTSETQRDAGSFRQTQQALLKSRLVLNAALRQPKIAELEMVRMQEDPVTWLEKELRVGSGASPEILAVMLSGDQPSQLKALVDAVVNAYMQEIVNKEQVKRQARLDHLKTIAAQYDEQLRRKRRTLRELAETIGTSDKNALAMMQLFSVEQFHLTQKELLQVRSDLRKLQTEAAGQSGEEVPLEMPSEAINEAMQKDPILIRQLALKQQLEDELTDAKRQLRQADDHPAVLRYMHDIAATKRMIEKRREELRPQIEARVREKVRLDAASAGVLTQKRIDFCKRLEKQLSEDIKRLEDEARTRNKGSHDIESLKTEITQVEEVSRKVAEEVEKLAVELQADPRVRVLEEAMIDGVDGHNRQLRNASAAGLGTLALVLLAVAWLEFRSRRVETVDQVVRGLGMKLMGALPPAPVRRPTGAEAPPGSAWQSAFHESVAAARTMLLHVARAESVQVVMVTSAVAGEGKTSLSSQLAASLARAGHKTLLVDGDLRKPDLHQVFGLENGPGLCEWLRGANGAADTIQRTSLANLWLLPTGECDGQTLQVLAQDRLKVVFDELKEMFEFVIVDSSPVLPVADAVQIGRHVDAVLFSILRNVSRLPRVYAASQRLTQLRVSVLGAVILNAQADMDNYGFHKVAAQAK